MLRQLLFFSFFIEVSATVIFFFPNLLLIENRRNVGKYWEGGFVRFLYFLFLRFGNLLLIGPFDEHLYLLIIILYQFCILIFWVFVMKQPQSIEAADKVQTSNSREQGNVHTRAKRELRTPQYLEDFITSKRNHRWAG